MIPGFTIDLAAMEPPTSGYVVGLNGLGRAVPASEAVAATATFAAEAILANHRAIGGWHDELNDEYVLDVVAIFDDCDEALHEAALNEQRYIWDLAQGVEIPVIREEVTTQ